MCDNDLNFNEDACCSYEDGKNITWKQENSIQVDSIALSLYEPAASWTWCKYSFVPIKTDSILSMVQKLCVVTNFTVHLYSIWKNQYFLAISLPYTAGSYPYSLLLLEHLVVEHAHKRAGSHKLCLPGSLNQPLSMLLSVDVSSAADCSSPASHGTYHQGNMAHQGPPHFCVLTGWKLVAILPGFQVTAMDALLEKAIQHSSELVVQTRQMLTISIQRWNEVNV
jgi:hypothetical protein